MTIKLDGLDANPPRNPIGGLPLYNDDEKEKAFPEAVLDLGRKVAAADALLIGSPEYNFSIPGVLKNAIDWLSRLPDQPFNDKPLGIMGAARGPVGTGRVQYHLRQVAVFVNMHPLNKPEVLISFAHEKFDDAGKLTDETTRGFIENQMAALYDWTLRIAAESGGGGR
jgi:chromate reductase